MKRIVPPGWAAIPFFASVLLIPEFSFSSTEFNATVAPETGFKTNVASPTDSLHRNCPFAAVSAGPSVSFSGNEYWKGGISADLSGTLYSNYTREYSVEPQVEIVHETEKSAFRIFAGAGYFSYAASYDPTEPQKFILYSGGAEYKRIAETQFLVNYTLSVYDDRITERFDAKNALKAKVTWARIRSFKPFLRIGAVWNESNADAVSYIQPSLAAGIIATLYEKTIVIAQGYAAYSIYNLGENGGKSVKSRSGMLETSGTVTNPRIPYSLAIISIVHSLSPHFDLLVNYTYLLYDPGPQQILYSSHRIGLGLQWTMKAL